MRGENKVNNTNYNKWMYGFMVPETKGRREVRKKRLIIEDGNGLESEGSVWKIWNDKSGMGENGVFFFFFHKGGLGLRNRVRRIRKMTH